MARLIRGAARPDGFMDGTFEGRSGFRAYVDRLEFAAIAMEAVPADAGGATGQASQQEGHRDGAVPVTGQPTGGPTSRPRSRRPWPGFLLHSLLGLGLRRAGCLTGGRCRERCEQPASCAWTALAGCQGDGRPVPLGRVARVPAPYRIEAAWQRWQPGDPLRARIWLFGMACRHTGTVRQALAVAAAGGVGSTRLPMRLGQMRAWRGRLGHLCRPARGEGHAVVQLELLTPLRLLRGRHPLRSFSLPDLARNLNLRLAVWGHYHQDLPWAPRWEFLEADARVARVVQDETRWESVVRYSARQQSTLRLGGLIGRVTLGEISPDLLALLRAAEVLGAGKGGTVGLGCVRVKVR